MYLLYECMCMRHLQYVELSHFLWMHKQFFRWSLWCVRGADVIVKLSAARKSNVRKSVPACLHYIYIYERNGAEKRKKRGMSGTEAERDRGWQDESVWAPVHEKRTNANELRFVIMRLMSCLEIVLNSPNWPINMHEKEKMYTCYAALGPYFACYLMKFCFFCRHIAENRLNFFSLFFFEALIHIRFEFLCFIYALHCNKFLRDSDCCAKTVWTVPILSKPFAHTFQAFEICVLSHICSNICVQTFSITINHVLWT